MQNGQDGGQGLSAWPHRELRGMDCNSAFVLIEVRDVTSYSLHQSVTGCR